LVRKLNAKKLSGPKRGLTTRGEKGTTVHAGKTKHRLGRETLP